MARKRKGVSVPTMKTGRSPERGGRTDPTPFYTRYNYTGSKARADAGQIDTSRSQDFSPDKSSYSPITSDASFAEDLNKRRRPKRVAKKASVRKMRRSKRK